MAEKINSEKYVRDGSLIWWIGYAIFSLGFWMMFTKPEREEIKSLLLEAIDLLEEKAAQSVNAK